MSGPAPKITNWSKGKEKSFPSSSAESNHHFIYTTTNQHVHTTATILSITLSFKRCSPGYALTSGPIKLLTYAKIDYGPFYRSVSTINVTTINSARVIQYRGLLMDLILSVALLLQQRRLGISASPTGPLMLVPYHMASKRPVAST